MTDAIYWAWDADNPNPTTTNDTVAGLTPAHAAAQFVEQRLEAGKRIHRVGLRSMAGGGTYFRVQWSWSEASAFTLIKEQP
jgi:hypothetical protein